MAFTLPASTGAASLTDAATTEAQQKTNLTNLRGFLAEMLGTDSSTRAAARSFLGVDAPGLAFSVAASAMTISLKTAAAADGTAAAPAPIPFRSATASSGARNVRHVTAALSMVVSSGSTLGCVSATDTWLFVYAMDNSGTVELAVCRTYQGKHLIGSTTAEGAAGTADSGVIIYSTTARSNVPMTLVGAVKTNQTTAGTWAAVPTDVRLADLFDAPVGMGQTWQGVTRTQSVTYYNTTGKPIVLTVHANVDTTAAYLTLTIDGTALFGPSSASSAYAHIDAIIPPNAAYSWTVSAGTVASVTTRELR